MAEIKLYNQDCMEAMQGIQTDSINLIVTLTSLSLFTSTSLSTHSVPSHAQMNGTE